MTNEETGASTKKTRYNWYIYHRGKIFSKVSLFRGKICKEKRRLNYMDGGVAGRSKGGGARDPREKVQKGWGYLEVWFTSRGDAKLPLTNKGGRGGKGGY